MRLSVVVKTIELFNLWINCNPIQVSVINNCLFFSSIAAGNPKQDLCPFINGIKHSQKCTIFQGVQLKNLFFFLSPKQLGIIIIQFLATVSLYKIFRSPGSESTNYQQNKLPAKLRSLAGIKLQVDCNQFSKMVFKTGEYHC